MSFLLYYTRKAKQSQERNIHKNSPKQRMDKTGFFAKKLYRYGFSHATLQNRIRNAATLDVLRIFCIFYIPYRYK